MDTVAYTGRAHARTHAEVDCTRTLFKAIGDVVAELRDKSTLWPDEHTADAHATAIGDLAQLLSSLESRLDRFEDHIATERETVATVRPVACGTGWLLAPVADGPQLIVGGLRMQARTLIADCAQEEQLMVHIANHLPPHLPGAQPELLQYEDPQPLMQQQQQRAFALPSASSSFRSSAATAVSVAVHLKDALAPAPPPGALIPGLWDLNGLTRIAIAQSDISDHAGKAQGAHKVDDKAKAPREYISLAELESCSKYMVGRLTQDRINCSIDELAGAPACAALPWMHSEDAQLVSFRGQSRWSKTRARLRCTLKLHCLCATVCHAAAGRRIVNAIPRCRCGGAQWEGRTSARSWRWREQGRPRAVPGGAGRAGKA